MKKSSKKHVSKIVAMLLTVFTCFGLFSNTILAADTPRQEAVQASAQLSAQEFMALAGADAWLAQNYDANNFVQTKASPTKAAKPISDLDLTKTYVASSETIQVTVRWVDKNGGVHVDSPWYAPFVRAKDGSFGEFVYCVEPGVFLDYTNSGFTPTPQDNATYKKIALASYFGLDANESGTKTLKDRMYTFYSIHSIFYGVTVTGMQGEGSMAAYTKRLNYIKKMLQVYDTMPSIKDTTVTLRAGETVTITDTNAVLAYYHVNDNKTGTSISKSGNSLSITATEASTSGTVSFLWQPVAKANQGTPILLSHPQRQDLLLVRVPSPDKQFNLNIKVLPPELSTSAVNKDTGTQEAKPVDKVTIVDTVAYKNLIPAKEYTVKGKLMDKATGQPLLVNGAEVTAEKTFKPKTADGSVTLEFTFDASALTGATIVVFETLYADGKQIATHSDINDAAQTIQFERPELATQARDGDNGTQVSYPAGPVTIIDTVSYQKVVPGKEYTIKGILMDKATGKPLLVNGLEIKAQTTFVPTAEQGTISLGFTLDASALAGTTVVVFESMYIDDKEVASHADINDVEQSITFPAPSIATQATDKATGGSIVQPDASVTIVDTVTYTNLAPNKEYVLSGILMNKQTNAPLLVDGQRVEAGTTFTPTQPDGTVQLEFTFNASALSGTSVVVFENLYHEGLLVASHADINDVGQTVEVEVPPATPPAPDEPTIGTTATDQISGTQQATPGGVVTIVDTVAYQNLEIGKEYTVKGKLMDKATGQPLQIAGAEVVSETIFTPTTPDGSVEVLFSFDTTGLPMDGVTVVVFEELYAEGALVTSHADIHDQGQTIKFPELQTNAYDKPSGTHLATVDGDITIVDTVMYANLIPGKEYTVEGVLMDKATNAPLLVGGAEVKASHTFTAPAANGSVDLEFIIPADALGTTTAVVFEDLYTDGIKVASHADINDEAQTVYIPAIGTKAVQGSNTATENYARIIDTVTYQNLIPGTRYTLTGILMDKTTNRPLLVNGQEITGQTSFVPDTPDGEAHVEFIFDAAGLNGKEIVVFEKLYAANAVVITHEDINDAAQTVTLADQPQEPEPPKGDSSSLPPAESNISSTPSVADSTVDAGADAPAPTSGNSIVPKTGDTNIMFVLVLVGALALAGMCVISLMLRKTKKSTKSEEQ